MCYVVFLVHDPCCDGREMIDFLDVFVDVRRPPFRLVRSNDHQFHNETRSDYQKQTKSDCHRLFFSHSLTARLVHAAWSFLSSCIKRSVVFVHRSRCNYLITSLSILIHIFLFFKHRSTSSTSHYFSLWSIDCKFCFPVIKKNKATKRKSSVVRLCKSASE